MPCTPQFSSFNRHSGTAMGATQSWHVCGGADTGWCGCGWRVGAGDLKRLIKKTAEAGKTLDEPSIWGFFAQVGGAGGVWG